MGTRPLRQYYDHDRTIEVDADLGPDVDTWRRHRRRFLAAVRALDEDQWKATTRCTAWDAKDVLCHVHTGDVFWAISLGAIPAGSPPTEYLHGFDPSDTTGTMVDPLRDLSYEEVLDRLGAGIDTLDAMLGAMTAEQWARRAESPMGHVPARFVFTHALWDSWTHERDILEPLGLAPPPEPDELLAATWFVFLLGGLQGGLLDDDDAVGPGPEAPIQVTLRFDDLPDDPLTVRYDRGIRISRAAPGEPATAAGSALALVEGLTGRGPVDATRLPEDLVAQMTRASAVL